MIGAKRNLFLSTSKTATEESSKKSKPDEQKATESKAVLEELNSIQVKKFSSLKELMVGENYQICSAKKIDTKYGNQILVELEEGFVFLPKRYTVMSESTLNELNTGNYAMKLVEVIGKTFNFHFCPNPENLIENFFVNSNNDFSYYRETNMQRL